jgi:hypothetical protein
MPSAHNLGAPKTSEMGLGCVKTSGEKRKSAAFAMGRRYYAGIMP